MRKPSAFVLAACLLGVAAIAAAGRIFLSVYPDVHVHKTATLSQRSDQSILAGGESKTMCFLTDECAYIV